MKLEKIDFCATDWSRLPTEVHPGSPGRALWRTQKTGDLRVRVVDYEPGYVADHWCTKGHIVFVVEGALITELRDGREFHLSAGMSYQVGDDAEPHRSRTNVGARIFIVD
jgi:hypothetical protein